MLVVKTARDAEEIVQHENEERYRSIIAVSLTGAWEYHSDTGYLWCSPEYYTMLGFSEEEFFQTRKRNLNDAWIGQLHPDDFQSATGKFEKYVKGGAKGMYENVFRLRHKDGSWLWILSRGRTLRKPDGSVGNVTLGTHINVTDKKNLEIELRKHYEQLLRYSFSNAHQVRGPVARMLGLLSLIRLEETIDYKWLTQKVEYEVEELDKITGTIARELDEIVKYTPQEDDQ
ncbi:PAS domain-containing protein [Chryseolinea lacunae]|uniref:histidine kinase n=1 Tax=Chryseolinea lacunae TaxID=2801331 RepID=A0ABS1KUB8_9BACT|nr:PAS domain-containing protein [Chryseolinea lacunae]MBL0743004.1 PAS domain-containing protein [Chryseolinea lacunae]